MAKAEWGTKRVCLNCSARFYDMLRDPIVCPSCETVVDPAPNLKPRRSRPAAKAAAVEKKPPAVEENDDLEVETEAEVDVEVDIDKIDDEDLVVKDDPLVVVAADDDEDEDGERAIEDVSELGDDDVSVVIDPDVKDEDGTS